VLLDIENQFRKEKNEKLYNATAALFSVFNNDLLDARNLNAYLQVRYYHINFLNLRIVKLVKF